MCGPVKGHVINYQNTKDGSYMPETPIVKAWYDDPKVDIKLLLSLIARRKLVQEMTFHGDAILNWKIFISLVQMTGHYIAN